MKRRIATTIVLAALGTAGPAAAAQPTTHSFDGRCTFSGAVTPLPPGSVFNGTGECVGSLDGAPSASHQTSVVAPSAGLTVPTLGLPILVKGSGTATFLNGPGAEDDVPLSFTLDQLTVAGLIKGRSSGQASLVVVPQGSARVAYVNTLGGPLVG